MIPTKFLVQQNPNIKNIFKKALIILNEPSRVKIYFYIWKIFGSCVAIAPEPNFGHFLT